MKKILITGASGFIGSFLVEEALNKNWDTWAGIRKKSSREYLTDERIKFIDLNYSNKEILKVQISEHVAKYGKWDYIIHNAGVTKCLNRKDFHRVNYLYSCNLIESLQETGNVPEKFILMSSLSAYPTPETAYGKSKLRAEWFLQDQEDFPYIILRPTGVYGPREKDYFLMLKTVQSGLDVTAGFETQYLTFIYVKDLARVAFLSLEKPVFNKAYFVADGDVYTDIEYTQIIKTVLEKKNVLKIRVPFSVLKTVSILAEGVSQIIRRPSTLNRDKYKIMKKRSWICDTIPMEQDLNFTAHYNLAQGIEESVDWYKKSGWLK